MKPLSSFQAGLEAAANDFKINCLKEEIIFSKGVIHGMIAARVSPNQPPNAQMHVDELYQCPYEKATQCKMDMPCKGCETWAAHQ